MSDNVPIDLWAQILVNLPVKSLLQCTSVCKQWHSLIITPSFITSHLSSSLRRPPLLFTPSPSADNTPQKRYFLTFHTDPPLQPTQNYFQSPFPARTNDDDDSILFYRVVGSLHGLVCLSDDTIYGFTNIIILWNPLIRRSVQLPRPQFTFATIGTFTMMVGFGFDSGKNDYKVVRILYRRGFIEHLLPPLVEVYSVNEGSWRKVNADYVKFLIWERVWTQCFIHGAMHWVAYKKSNVGSGRFYHVILLFDVGTEVFRTMRLPESLVYADAAVLSVAVIGGLLSVFDESTTTIWVQREYGEVSSWTKMFNFCHERLDLGVVRRCVETVLNLKSGVGGGEMTCDCRDLQLPGLYGVSTDQLIGTSCVGTSYVFSYTESLLMLDKQRWIKKEKIMNRPKRGEIKVHMRSKKLRIVGLKKSRKKLQARPKKAEIDSLISFFATAIRKSLEAEKEQMRLDSDLSDSSEESVENHDRLGML